MGELEGARKRRASAKQRASSGESSDTHSSVASWIVRAISWQQQPHAPHAHGGAGGAGGAASMLATRGVGGISAGIGVTGVSVAEPLADAQGGMLGCCC